MEPVFKDVVRKGTRAAARTGMALDAHTEYVGGEFWGYHFHFGAGDAFVVIDAWVTPSRLLAGMRERTVRPVVTETLTTGKHLRASTSPVKRKRYTVHG